MAAGEYPLDPEHLICNGLGGAFLHPTHVFAHARFAPIAGRDADDAFVHSSGVMPGARHFPGARPPLPSHLGPCFGLWVLGHSRHALGATPLGSRVLPALGSLHCGART